MPPPGTDSAYWSNISSLGAAAPTGTLGGAMAFDPELNATVLVGADGFDYALYSDSFTYQDYNWTAVADSVPDEFAALAYDSSSADLVAFGGEAPFGTELGATIPTNATYALLAGLWVNISANLSVAPPASGNPLMTTDPAAGYALLLDPIGGTNSSQTWAYSDGVWTNLTATAGPPPPGPGGSDSLLTYDPELGAPIFFGGSLPGPGFSIATNETWEFYAGRWTDLNLSGPDFTTGSVQTMAYDAATGAMVDLLAPADLYSANGTPSYEEWQFAEDVWSNESGNVSPTPPIGYDPASVWDVADGYLLYLSGGYDAQSWALGQIPLKASLSVSPSPVDVGSTTTIRVNATGGAPPLLYQYSGLPAGCQSNSFPTLSCAPSVAGNYTIHAQVEDADNLTLNLSATLAVGPTLVASGPLFSNPMTYLGSSVNFSVSVAGGVPPYNLSWSLPNSACDPPDLVRFACTVDRPGPSLIWVIVTDATPFAGVNVSEVLTVVSPLALSSLVVSSNPVEVGTALTFNTTASGGAPPLSYDYSALPPGCTSNNSPQLSCVVSEAGAYLVSVRVTDSLGTVRTMSVAVVVVPAVQIAEEVAPNPAPLGFVVTFAYAVSGGMAPFHVSWTDLPLGCVAEQTSFSCEMNESGSFDVGLSVRDGLGGLAASNATLVVLPPGALPASAGGVEPVVLGASVIVIVVGVAAALFLSRRRRRAAAGPAPARTPDDLSAAAEAPVDSK